jgi:hypothetical protein
VVHQVWYLWTLDFFFKTDTCNVGSRYSVKSNPIMSQINMIYSNLILKNLTEKNKIDSNYLLLYLCFTSKRNKRNDLIRKHNFSRWQMLEHKHGDRARTKYCVFNPGDQARVKFGTKTPVNMGIRTDICLWTTTFYAYFHTKLYCRCDWRRKNGC